MLEIHMYTRNSMAFFLLSVRSPAQPLDLCAADREGEAPFERVCGI
jgi:hypothetical protein